jgi:G3E family GTPase
MSDAYEFNHLIIETTGIAEPDGIASAFIGGNKSSKFVLDGTVCLADAQDIVLNLDERGEATKQISFADIVLLNKIDLVTKEQLLGAKTRIKKQNTDAPILEASFGKVEKDVLKLNAYDGNSLENKLLNPHHHHHHNELVAHSFEFGEALLADKFEHWITMLLFLSGYQIYRIKGILNFEGETHKVIFQSVRSNSKIEIGSPWMEGEIRKSKIVFIGNNVKKEVLKKGLKGCLKK